MRHPGILLAILLLLALIGGRVLVHVHDRNTAKPIPASQPTPKANGNGSPSEDDPETADPPQPLTQAASGKGAAMESVLLNEAYKVSKARNLQYQEALVFQPSTATAIQQAWQTQLTTFFPSDSLARLGLALQTLGILPADEDLVARYRLRPNFSPEVFYAPLEGRLLHSESLAIDDPESEEWLTAHLILMLLDQNFRWHEEWVPVEVNMDQALAQYAFVLGDTFWQTLKRTRTDAVASHAWKRTDALTGNWPRALREAEFLPLREGVHFCQSVSSQNVALDSIYQQMPTSTTHIIHPDRYLEIPRWEPRRLAWARLDINRTEPLWENVIGELMLRAWLQSVLPAEEAGLLASRWEGDGVLLYQTPDQGPQLVWKTAWRDAAAAEQFFNQLGENAATLFGMEGEPARAENSLTFEGVLGLKVTHAEDTVTVLRTTKPAWRETLEDIALRSSFQPKTP